jgi:hypothetical protein
VSAIYSASPERFDLDRHSTAIWKWPSSIAMAHIRAVFLNAPA